MMMNSIRLKGKKNKLLLDRLDKVYERARDAVINEYERMCVMLFRIKSMLN